MRQPGYYWVKLPNVNWQPALWHDNNGDGSDFMWRVQQDAKRYDNHIYRDDDRFEEINETRIPAPDEADNPALLKNINGVDMRYVETQKNGDLSFHIYEPIKPLAKDQVANNLRVYNIVPTKISSQEEAERIYGAMPDCFKMQKSFTDTALGEPWKSIFDIDPVPPPTSLD